MTTRNLLPLIVGLALLGITLWGCGGDDGGGTPQVEDCGITVTAPALATLFQPGDDTQDVCTIRWSSTGDPAGVDITLRKADQEVGTIALAQADNGLYFWTADNMGAANGADYTIRVTASDDDTCYGDSPQFSLVNLDGCNFVFTNDMVDEYTDTEVLNLTWTSQHTSGSVDIELHTLGLGYLATIAEGTPDDGSFDWNVDSYHFSNYYEFYQLHLVDSSLESCTAVSDTFAILDSDICTIVVVEPAEGDSWSEGESRDIVLDAAIEVSAVELRLYVGSVFVGLIAQDVDITQASTYTWTVNDFDQVIGGNSNYRIRAYNVDDQYCVGVSQLFTIIPE